MVQTGTFTGLVVASAINVGTNYLVWGWRLSLGLAAVPGAILLLGEDLRPLNHFFRLHRHANGMLLANRWLQGHQQGPPSPSLLRRSEAECPEVRCSRCLPVASWHAFCSWW